MKTFAYLAVVAVALSACGQQPSKSGAEKAAGPSASGRDQVWAAGSSTVFPFATRVAENVAKTTGGRPAKVESLGTGGGFKLFCGGSGAAFPDVANASRPMKKSEFEQCVTNGVTDIVEIKIGYDGIVIANAKSGPTYDFKLDQVYRGVAAELPAGAGFAKNTAKSWKDVDASSPPRRSWSTARRLPRAPVTPSSNSAWKRALARSRRSTPCTARTRTPSRPRPTRSAATAPGSTPARTTTPSSKP